jgi:hypothetical protein
MNPELSVAGAFGLSDCCLSLRRMTTTRLRVQLRDVAPTVVRVLDVPARATLPEVHFLLQRALGWKDGHLHEFEADGRRYGMDDEDDELIEAFDVPLTELGSRFVYLYDFGDGWEHDVEVLGEGAAEPGVVAGEGTCPPEDCGGSSGYADLRAALEDQSHPEHQEYLDWCGPLQPFDLAWADRAVRSGARLFSR